MFITFEGIEGCGKSTQARLLRDHLEGLKVPVLLTREPGGTAIGAVIRRILLDANNTHLSPRAELFLYAADRAQHVAEVIAPALAKGLWVLCDRFFDATTVYQGVARGQDLAMVEFINRAACQDVFPDITFLIDLGVETALSRARSRNRSSHEKNQDRFEREELDFHEKVRNGYLALSTRDPTRFVVIHGGASVEEIASRIRAHLQPWIEERGT
jgi:dTMP kinase